MKLLIVVVMVACALLSCGCTSKDKAETTSQRISDSIIYDLLAANFLAYHNTRNEVVVVDQVYPGYDTIYVEDMNIHLMETYDPTKFFDPVIGHFVVLKTCEEYICTWGIYDRSGRFLKDGYMTRRATLALLNPDLKEQKAHFYDVQEVAIERFRKNIRLKYDLSERALDSLLYSELERMRN
jgi:hypothetical protein